MADEPEILFDSRGALGLITLNRPKALNALTHDMCVRMRAQLDVWASDRMVRAVAVRGAGDKAFCAGGDLRALAAWGRDQPEKAARFWHDEYLLNARIKHYPKPFVAMLKGVVMGGGAGISVHGSHCIVDDTVTFAMPETGIGLFPDVGGSYFLSRLPGNLGLYLALTGARLGAADCLYARLARAYVPAVNTERVLAQLSDGRHPDQALAGLSGPTASPPLLAIASEIEAVFSGRSVEEIGTNLQAENWDWSRRAFAAFCAKSPTSQKIAFRQLALGRDLDFASCLRMEYRIGRRILEGHDFYEGVRATILERSGAPRWQPERLEDVRENDIARYFAPLARELPV